MGTAAYRNKKHSEAAAHWQYILEAPVKYEGEDEIKAMALSTLTFLTYQGLGVKQDRVKAVEMWKEAVKKGDLEARRHLGFAFSDNDFRYQDNVVALGWYESIFLLYPTPQSLNEPDSNIYQDAQDGASALREKLTLNQREEAVEFAKSTL